MKFIISFLISLFLQLAFAQEQLELTQDQVFNAKISEIYQLYTIGRFATSIEKLTILETDLNQSKDKKDSLLGLVYYWKGLNYNRSQDFSNAITFFKKSIDIKYTPKDIYYEYGQALYASEKLPEARLAFKESLGRSFKKPICLYYIAFITQTLKENKKAVNLYKAVEKLPETERAEVLQPSRFQIGDIYLEEAEKQPDAFRAIENYVIPQYQHAIKAAPESDLAKQIQTKIRELQQKYDLVLFRLRNGRPTLIPPYYLRFSQDITNDSNVIFAPTETSYSSSDTSTLVSKTDVMGRYTYYYKNFMSFAPEIRMNYTYHIKRKEQIYRNDNYLIAPAIRTAYEHSMWKKPASHLFDFDYSYIQRDVNADKKLVFASRAYSFMVGERFNRFSIGESIVRLKRRIFNSYASSNNSKSTSFSFEQVASMKTGHILLLNANMDQTRVDNDVYDTNAITTRMDLIFPRYRELFTPSVGFSLTRTDPINNSDRGTEWMYNPSLKLAKTFKKNYRLNFHYDYQKNDSKDKDNFAFKRQYYGLEFEYLF